MFVDGRGDFVPDPGQKCRIDWKVMPHILEGSDWAKTDSCGAGVPHRLEGEGALRFIKGFWSLLRSKRCVGM